LSEEAFADIMDYDHLPLVYYRFSKALPEGGKFPPPIDLSKLHKKNDLIKKL